MPQGECCQEDRRPRSAVPVWRVVLRPSLPVEVVPMAELEECLTPHGCTPSSQLCAWQRQPFQCLKGKGLSCHTPFSTSHFFSCQGGRGGTLRLGSSRT